jgi:RimJ/RimL family protein N-acetyltransferase
MSDFYTHQTSLTHPNPHILLTSNTIPDLSLRTPTQTDAHSLLRIFSNPENTSLDSSASDLANPEAINNLITEWTKFSKPLERANNVIVVKGQVVGICGLGLIYRSSDSKTIGDAGVLLGPECRGKGYSYEALRMVIDHGFRVFDLDEIHILTREENTAMKGLMNSRFGFMGTRIEGDKFGNDWIWKINKVEWNESKHSR